MRSFGLMLMAVFACGGSAAGGEQLDAALKQLETFKAEMCACKANECASKVEDSIDAWRTQSKPELDKVVATVEKVQEFQKQSEAIERAIRECHRARTDKLAGALARAEEFADEACACKDRICATDIETDHDQWRKRLSKSVTDDDLKLTKEFEHELVRSESRMQDCIAKLTDGDLTITSISPETGDANGGTYAIVKGSGFTETRRSAKIYFGPQRGEIVRFQSDTELVVMAPAGKAGELVDVTINFHPGGQKKLDKAFKFVVKDGTTVDDLVTP